MRLLMFNRLCSYYADIRVPSNRNNTLYNYILEHRNEHFTNKIDIYICIFIMDTYEETYESQVLYRKSR